MLYRAEKSKASCKVSRVCGAEHGSVSSVSLHASDLDADKTADGRCGTPLFRLNLWCNIRQLSARHREPGDWPSLACDVGGGFGQKGIQTVEDILVPFAAMEIGRPVRWIEERGENLTAGAHARDQIHRIAVAATREGRILAIRDDAVVNFGAFNSWGSWSRTTRCPTCSAPMIFPMRRSR